MLALVPLALLVSACAVGGPEPPTYVSDTGVTLNASVYSSVNGPTEYWFVYGETGDEANWLETPHRTLDIFNREKHPVSEPVDGLAPDTSYGWQVCVADQQESPPREVCSKRQSVSTATGAGTSGIAFSSDRDGDDEVYVMDVEGGNPTNLTNNLVFDDGQPSWSPDGKQIAFVSNRDGNREIYIMDADGENPTRVTNNPDADHDPSWSPAGDRILFTRGQEGTSWNGNSIYGINPDGTNEQHRATPPVSNSEIFQYDPAWSPDAGGLAWGVFVFALNGGPTACGDDFCWLLAADDSGSGRIRGGGTTTFFPAPDWHPRGRDLVYNCASNPTNLCAAGFNGDGETSLGAGSHGSWSPDGSSIAFDNGGDVYTMDADGDNRNNLTDGEGTNSDPDWSPRPKPSSIYIAMGDSVTQIGDAQRYPERFFSFLDAAGEADVLHNIGENGQTSGGINGTQLTTARELIDDPTTDATVVTIDIGGNDILFFGDGCHPQGGAGFNLTTCQSTLNQFSSNFTTTLQALNESIADDPGAEQLIVMAYYNPWSGDGDATVDDNGNLVLRGTDRTLDCGGTGEQLGLNDRIACIGADHNAKLADAYPPFIGHGAIGNYFYDDIHPNGTGHQVIANTFQAAYETP
jgi:lysophospholipase L1-like esterase